jgi:hypothetical protein
MCNHLNLRILIHIFTIVYLIIIIIIMRGEHFVAHLDGLGGTPMCITAIQERKGSKGPDLEDDDDDDVVPLEITHKSCSLIFYNY